MPRTVAMGPATQALLPERIGFLLTQQADGLHVREAVVIDRRVALLPMASVASADGIRVCRPAGRGAGPCDRQMADTVRTGCEQALKLVAMLSARNAPLVVGPAEDCARLNARRAARGRPPVLGTRPVRWDLSRARRAPSAGGTSAEARADAIAAIVRGHPKVRKTGVFWWRPHVRNARGGPEPRGRDYDVVDRR